MTLTQLRYLIAIVDADLNITKAAERVFATQPGISKQLRQIEGELGFRVFEREGRKLTGITSGGAKVLERARTIVGEVDNIRTLAANLKGATEGELRIATTHTQARFVLPPAISSLAREFPDVMVRLLPGRESETVNLLESGEVDFALISTVGEPPPGAAHAIPLYRWQRRVIVPKTHPLAKLGRQPSLDDLAAHPLVSYDSSRLPTSSLRQAFAGAGLEPQIACTAHDAELIKTYVRAGLGPGVLAEMAWQPEDAADLASYPATELPSCTAWLLLRQDILLRDFMLAFITNLAPQLKPRELHRMIDGDDGVEWPEAPWWRAEKSEKPPSVEG